MDGNDNEGIIIYNNNFSLDMYVHIHTKIITLNTTQP